MLDFDRYYQEEFIEKNICRWNLNVYNCHDEAYFRSVYYIKCVIAIGVSLLASVLIIYRTGIRRRNLITPYGIASIDGLLIFLLLYSYAMIFHSITILKSEYISNMILQEFSFQAQYIFVLIAIQVYLTGTLNASPRYQGSRFYYPRPRIINIISVILLIIWSSIELILTYFVGKNRNFFYTSSDEKNNTKIKNYKYIIYGRYLIFGGACVITFAFFLLFGHNLNRAAKRSLEDMYRNKKIKSNVVIPIRMAILKMRWINSSCSAIMGAFAILFILMGIMEQYIFEDLKYSSFSKFLCIAMNLIPPALTFIVLLSIVYGEARTDIISVFPSTHFEEDDYQMNYTRQSQASSNNI